MSVVDIYVRSQRSVRVLTEAMADSSPVAATPDWDVRALLAHVVGVAHDVANGKVDGYATSDWTRTQVRDRVGATRKELFAEWETVTPAFTAVLEDPTAHGLDALFSVLPVVDLVAHQCDLCEAAEHRPEVDADAWAVIGPRREAVLAAQVAMAGLPPLEVRTPEGDVWHIGDGDPVGRVVAPRYELWRSLEGRRERSAVRSFEWTTDPKPYLDIWPAMAFHWPEPPTRE